MLRSHLHPLKLSWNLNEYNITLNKYSNKLQFLIFLISSLVISWDVTYMLALSSETPTNAMKCHELPTFSCWNLRVFFSTNSKPWHLLRNQPGLPRSQGPLCSPRPAPVATAETTWRPGHAHHDGLALASFSEFISVHDYMMPRCEGFKSIVTYNCV